VAVGGGGGGGGTIVPPNKVALRNSIKALTKSDGSALVGHLFELTADPKANVTDQVGSLTQLAESGTTVYNVDSTPSAGGVVPYNLGPAITTGGGGSSGIPDPTGFTAVATLQSDRTVTVVVTQDTQTFTGQATNRFVFEESQDDGATWSSAAFLLPTTTFTARPVNKNLLYRCRLASTTTVGGASPTLLRRIDVGPAVMTALVVPRAVEGIVSGLRVYWTDPPSEQQITQIQVRYRKDTDVSFGAWQTFGLGTSVGDGSSYGDILGLDPVLYDLEIRPARTTP
jgi:hypothetical protein